MKLSQLMTINRGSLVSRDDSAMHAGDSDTHAYCQLNFNNIATTWFGDSQKSPSKREFLLHHS